MKAGGGLPGLAILFAIALGLVRSPGDCASAMPASMLVAAGECSHATDASTCLFRVAAQVEGGANLYLDNDFASRPDFLRDLGVTRARVLAWRPAASDNLAGPGPWVMAPMREAVDQAEARARSGATAQAALASIDQLPDHVAGYPTLSLRSFGYGNIALRLSHRSPPARPDVVGSALSKWEHDLAVRPDRFPDAAALVQVYVSVGDIGGAGRAADLAASRYPPDRIRMLVQARQLDRAAAISAGIRQVDMDSAARSKLREERRQRAAGLMKDEKAARARGSQAEVGQIQMLRRITGADNPDPPDFQVLQTGTNDLAAARRDLVSASAGERPELAKAVADEALASPPPSGACGIYKWEVVDDAAVFARFASPDVSRRWLESLEAQIKPPATADERYGVIHCASALIEGWTVLGDSEHAASVDRAWRESDPQLQPSPYELMFWDIQSGRGASRLDGELAKSPGKAAALQALRYCYVKSLDTGDWQSSRACVLKAAPLAADREALELAYWALRVAASAGAAGRTDVAKEMLELCGKLATTAPPSQTLLDAEYNPVLIQIAKALPAGSGGAQ